MKLRCVVPNLSWVCVLDEVIIDLLYDLLPLDILRDYPRYRRIKRPSVCLRGYLRFLHDFRHFLLFWYQRRWDNFGVDLCLNNLWCSIWLLSFEG